MVGRPVFVPLGQHVDRVFHSAADWVGDNRTLSDRLWMARHRDRAAIDSILRHGLATGADPIAVAKALEDYLTPVGRATTTSTPRSGKGNAAARTLSRTETSHAFNEGVRQAAEANPFVIGVKWNLSASSHKDQDQCDDNARNSSPGLSPGVYRPSELPRMPSHPNCRCWASQVTVENTDSVVAQLRRDISSETGNVVQMPRRSSAWQKLVGLVRAAKALVTREAA